MKEIHIWQIDGNNINNLEIERIEAVAQTETEQLLEEILVQKPELLLPDLRIVGRQTDTPGGPLDLLGVDGDGRLVIFELKRGTLTRDAVAQIIDYASFLHELSAEDLAVHISERSGKSGIPKIDNFLDWYTEQFARNFSNNQTPRLILVGLGADERARRMVSFLANSDLDVSLITFYGFKRDNKVLLARQLEVEAKPQVTVSSLKSNNLDKLKERIKKNGVENYYLSMSKFFKENLPSAYEWPNPSGFTYYLPEITESGNQSNRAFLSLYLNDSKKGNVLLYLHPRAISSIILGQPEIESVLIETLKISSSGVGELWLKNSEEWLTISAKFVDICQALLEGWKLKRETSSNGGETVDDSTTSENSNN